MHPVAALVCRGGCPLDFQIEGSRFCSQGVSHAQGVQWRVAVGSLCTVNWVVGNGGLGYLTMLAMSCLLSGPGSCNAITSREAIDVFACVVVCCLLCCFRSLVVVVFVLGFRFQDLLFVLSCFLEPAFVFDLLLRVLCVCVFLFLLFRFLSLGVLLVLFAFVVWFFFFVSQYLFSFLFCAPPADERRRSKREVTPRRPNPTDAPTPPTRDGPARRRNDKAPSGMSTRRPAPCHPTLVFVFVFVFVFVRFLFSVFVLCGLTFDFRFCCHFRLAF